MYIVHGYCSCRQRWRCALCVNKAGSFKVQSSQAKCSPTAHAPHAYHFVSYKVCHSLFPRVVHSTPTGARSRQHTEDSHLSTAAVQPETQYLCSHTLTTPPLLQVTISHHLIPLPTWVALCPYPAVSPSRSLNLWYHDQGAITSEFTSLSRIQC